MENGRWRIFAGEVNDMQPMNEVLLIDHLLPMI